MHTQIQKFWFKGILALALIVVAASIGYYFVSFLPSQAKERLAREWQESLFNKNLDCQKYQKPIQEKESGTFKMTVMSGVFYSSKVNSCLYGGLDWDNKIKIRDAITGQDVFSEELKDMKLGGTVGEEIKAQIELYK